MDCSRQRQEKWNNKSTFFISVSCKISQTPGCLFSECRMSQALTQQRSLLAVCADFYCSPPPTTFFFFARSLFYEESGMPPPHCQHLVNQADDEEKQNESRPLAPAVWYPRSELEDNIKMFKKRYIIFQVYCSDNEIYLTVLKTYRKQQR